MSKNGFLESMLNKGLPVLERIDKQNLCLFYPSFTKESRIEVAVTLRYKEAI